MGVNEDKIKIFTTSELVFVIGHLGFLPDFLYLNIHQPGISEGERTRRLESNTLSTKINFLAWLFEVNLNTYLNNRNSFFSHQVMGSFVVIIPNPLMPDSLRIVVWKSLSTIAPPIFYIVATEKESFKDTLKLCRMPCSNAAVHPLIV